jgi:phage baseplate assembly protein W
MNGIGPKLPLQRDDKFGNYGLISSYNEEVKQNFKNLLLTCPGERMMIPDFGVGLRNFLFEPRSQAVPKIRQRVHGQVARYMPFIRINKLHFNHNIDPEIADDLNVLSILIEYEVPSINLSTSITFQSEDIN